MTQFDMNRCGESTLPQVKSSRDAHSVIVAQRCCVSAPRRGVILDAALIVAAAGGYEAVQMGTVYRYFPSKTHLLASAVIRQFQRLDAACDWPVSGTTRQQRLNQLTARLHDEWRRAPLLTEAMIRTFVVANATAATEVIQAATVIERLLARTLGDGRVSTYDQQVAGLIADIWLAKLMASIGQRASATETRDRIERATQRILTGDAPGVQDDRPTDC